MSNVNPISNLLEFLAIEAEIPSTNVKVKIKPITIKQIKDVVDANTDKPYFDIGFKRAITTVLIANIMSTESVKLTEADVNILFVYLKNGGNYNNTKVSDIIEQLKVNESVPQKKILTYNNVQLTLNTPSVERLHIYDDCLLNSIEVDSEGKLKDERSTGNLYFLIEMLKYVESITVDSIEVFGERVVEEQLELVRELPFQIANEIVTYSQALQSGVTKALTYTDIILPFDISFFE